MAGASKIRKKRTEILTVVRMKKSVTPPWTASSGQNQITSVMSARTFRAAIQASHSTASKPRTRPSCQKYVRINPSPRATFAPRDVENQHTVSTWEGNDKQRMRRAIPSAVIGLQQTRATAMAAMRPQMSIMLAVAI